MSTPDLFAVKIKEWAEKTSLDTRKVINAACLQLSTMIIKDTPVGNPALWQSPPPKGYVGGTARGNWIPSVGSYTPVFDDGAYAKTEVGVIEDVEDISSYAAGSVFYLINSTPYIGRLEYQGWSSQAPTGMVRTNVINFNKALTDAIAAL